MAEEIIEFEKTPLWYELLEVLGKCDQHSQVTWKAIVHLDDNGTLYNPITVHNVMIKRDYVLSYADEMMCTLSIPLGKYARKIYPNRNRLQITLLKMILQEGTTIIDPDAPVETERFSATLIEDGPAVAEIQGQETTDEASLDLVNILDVRFQLFNKATEKIRITQVGGIYRKTTVSDVMLSCITPLIKDLKIDNVRNMAGVDLVPTNNPTKYEQIILPQGTKLIDVPGYLQNRFGVYSAGLGSYVQNRFWYIYPLYDTNRFNASKRTLTIFILPKKKYPELERTYRILGPAITVLCTSDSDFRGDNEISYANEGNGVRFADADRMLSGFIDVKNNKATAKRRANINEFSAAMREDGVNYSPISGTRITSNPHQHYTELAARKGGVLRLTWENSNPSLIEPGMVTRIVYFDNNQLKEAYGNVLGCSTAVVKVGDFNTDKHSSNTQLVLFTNLKQK